MFCVQSLWEDSHSCILLHDYQILEKLRCSFKHVLSTAAEILTRELSKVIEFYVFFSSLLMHATKSGVAGSVSCLLAHSCSLGLYQPPLWSSSKGNTSIPPKAAPNCGLVAWTWGEGCHGFQRGCTIASVEGWICLAKWRMYLSSVEPFSKTCQKHWVAVTMN